MRKTRIIMGMPIIVEIIDDDVSPQDFKTVFDYFRSVDKRFSTYKKNSEISKINSGKLVLKKSSKEMKTIFKLAIKTKLETNGFFNIERDGYMDPSGLVKGWAVFNAAKIIRKMGRKNFYINCGGDIQVSGNSSTGKNWRVGIKNPFNDKEIVKVLKIKESGVATSGNYIRGNHIYNPKAAKLSDDVVSFTVVGPNIYEADRFATAAFAMGRVGINFIENLVGFEGYMIDKTGIAKMTSGFEKYIL